MAAGEKTEAVERFWQAFRTAAGTRDGYDVVSFDDSPETATELAELVVDGRKRATAALLRQFSPEGEPLPTTRRLLLAEWESGRSPAMRQTPTCGGVFGSNSAAASPRPL